MAESCCPPGSLPYLAKGETYQPKGHVHVLPPCETRSHPCRLYLAGVENLEDATAWQGKRIVIAIHDAFGPTSGYHTLFCDDLAQRLKAIVVLPDCYRGLALVPECAVEETPKQLGFNFLTLKLIFLLLFGKAKSFLLQFPYENDLDNMLADQIVPYLKGKTGTNTDEPLPLAMTGFCFGGWFIFKASCDSKMAPHFKCGVSFHPSVVNMEKGIFGRDEFRLCQEVSGAHLIVSTPQEPKEWHAGEKVEELLKANTKVTDVQFIETKLSHGFMTRADRTDPNIVKEIEAILAPACDFLNKHYPPK